MSLPPGPTWKSERARPLKERLAELARGPIPLIRKRFETYGDLYYVAQNPGLFVLRHPDHIRDVLVTKAGAFAKRTKDLEPFLGLGLLTSNGALWRRQRRLIQPAFQKHKIATYCPTMVEHTLQMLDGWKPGEVRDIGREMMELTLRVVCKSIFEFDSSGGPAEEVAKAMAVLQETTGVFDPLPGWMPTPLHLKRARAVKRLDDIIYPMIDARDPGGTDLIAQLKAAADEQGTMSRKQLRDELVTMFLAGHETTALAMTWAFYLLSENPIEEGSLHEEVDRVLGGRPPSFEDLEALPFTRLVVQETLRLFPPIYMLPRVAVEDAEIGGFDVPAGSELILWVYLCQRDPRWFPNPDAFIPGRFLPGTGGALHAHAYLPFGAGGRTCVGLHFAMAEAQLILAAVAQRYKLRLEPGQQVQLNPRVTLGPKEPIRLRVEAR